MEPVRASTGVVSDSIYRVYVLARSNSEFLRFCAGVFVIFGVGSFMLTLLGLDMVSAASTAVSTLANIGPGVGTIGPTENYAHIPAVGKWLLSFLMLVGRLEVFTVLVIFNRHFWIK